MADPGNPLDLDALEAAGIHVTTVNTKVAGATTRLDRPLAVGQRVVVVADCVVADVGLKGPASTIRLNRVLTANELFDLEPDAGARVLAALRAANVQVDTTKGHEELPGMVGTVDASGVVVTEAEKAALNGGEAGGEADLGLDFALAWAREHFGHAFDLGEDEYVAALDDIDELEPLAVRRLLLVERNGDDREDIIEALTARLDEELQRAAEVPPWEGYAKAGIEAVRSRIEAVRIDATDPVAWSDFLERVRLFEEANKARKGVLDFVGTFVAAEPAETTDTWPPTPPSPRPWEPAEPASPALPGEAGE